VNDGARAALCVATLAWLLGLAAPAAADDGAAAVTRSAVDADLRGYYGGERVAAYVIGGLGAAGAGAGAYLVTRGDDLSRGLGWSWLSLGGLELLGAAFYSLQVGGEIDHYHSALVRDPAGYRAEEMDHIQGTESRFVYYRAIELGLTLAGAGMAGYGLAARRDVWIGTGLGVGSLALPLLVIDSFNDARARRYLDEVKRFQPAVGISPAATPGGWQLSLSGGF
jgi:hypothetical protein